MAQGALARGLETGKQAWVGQYRPCPNVKPFSQAAEIPRQTGNVSNGEIASEAYFRLPEFSAP